MQQYDRLIVCLESSDVAYTNYDACDGLIFQHDKARLHFGGIYREDQGGSGASDDDIVLTFDVVVIYNPAFTVQVKLESYAQRFEYTHRYFPRDGNRCAELLRTAEANDTSLSSAGALCVSQAGQNYPLFVEADYGSGSSVSTQTYISSDAGTLVNAEL